jgi:UPF0755 protein
LRRTRGSVVADWQGRTSEEREAARLERERRRAERSGQAQPPPPQPEPEPDDVEDLHEDDYEDSHHDYEDGHDDDYEHEEHEPDGDAPDELEFEPAVGTRRVSRMERMQSSVADDDGGGFRARSQRQRKERRHPWRGRILALVALVLGIAAIWFLVQLFQPFHGSGHGSVLVRIPPHSTSGQVGDLLERDGVISSAFFFELRGTLSGQRGDLRSGTYHLKLDMNYSDVLNILTRPPPPVPTTQLTIVPGRTRLQTSALLRSEEIHGSYMAATRHSPLLDPHRYGAPRGTNTLEGFLWPDTFQLVKPVSISKLVDDQLTRFRQEFPKVNLSYARRRHLSDYDVLIIASIIEKEAATSHDLPLVSSVIYNRLKAHMPLGMDSTTRYEFNDYTKPLTNSQLASRSPYNTRVHTGLPPTPIGNPSLEDIEAAAHPASTSYYYFVANPCGGSSKFSSNYQQFLRDSAYYQHVRAQHGGRLPKHC